MAWQAGSSKILGMTDQHKLVTQMAQNFIDQLGVRAALKVQFDKENNIYKIDLESDNPGVLIGHHGEALSALQLMIGQHIKAQTGEWANLSVNVNDYREKREEALRLLVDDTVGRVLATGQPHTLPPMPANERRFVHLYLADHVSVKSESMGDGRARSVVICPK